MRLDDDGGNNLWLGSTLVSLGRHEQALPYLRKALGLDEDSAASNWWLGTTLAKLGMPDEALPYLQKAVEVRGSENDRNSLEATLAELRLRDESRVRTASNKRRLMYALVGAVCLL